MISVDSEKLWGVVTKIKERNVVLGNRIDRGEMRQRSAHLMTSAGSVCCCSVSRSEFLSTSSPRENEG